MNGFDSFRLGQRSTAAQWVLSGAFCVLLGAFFRTQVIQHEKFQLKAETNRLRPVSLTAPRGQILDRNGRIIAENVPGYSVKLIAANADSVRATLARLRPLLPMDSAGVESIVRRYRQTPFQPVTIVGDAPFDLVSRLEEHRPLYPGLVVQAEPKRVYPMGRAVAHLVGYVAEVSENDISNNRFPGAQLGTVVGKAGLERQYDNRLRGTEGIRYIEVNARGRLVREGAPSLTLQPQSGTAIRTTIDLDLQRFVDSIWPAGVRGGLVAMTPDGQVRALYSAPTFDPNEFIGGIPAPLWRALNADSAVPLLNRAIQARYPPASPFKLATAAMGLRRGIVKLDTRMTIPCSGGMQFGNRYFRCWKRGGHGNVDLKGAVAQSCDVYFYQLGLRLGLDAIIEDGKLMGFDQRTGVDLRDEKRPIYPGSREYFDKLYGKRGWSPGATTLNFSIGQGENTQTVINMVRFYAAISGDGSAHTPYLVPHRDSLAPRDIGVSAKDLEQLRLSMVAVLEEGTAGASRRYARGLQIGGKTGTAQNSHGLDHGWFIGYAPADKPQIVVGAIMEFFEHGSTVAPYVVRSIARYLVGPEPPPAAPVVVRGPADTVPPGIRAAPPSADTAAVVPPDAQPQIAPAAVPPAAPGAPGAEEPR